MITCASPGGVSVPKFIVPRQSRLTERPDRPRCVYSMTQAFHGHRPAPSPPPGARGVWGVRGLLVAWGARYLSAARARGYAGTLVAVIPIPLIAAFRP